MIYHRPDIIQGIYEHKVSIAHNIIGTRVQFSMKSKAALFSFLAFFSCVAGISIPLYANPSAQGLYLSAVDKSMAAELARQAYGGKVLSVDEIKEDGQTIYRVKLLLEGGRIKIVTVDGNSGKVA